MLKTWNRVSSWDKFEYQHNYKNISHLNDFSANLKSKTSGVEMDCIMVSLPSLEVKILRLHTTRIIGMLIEIYV
jgi:hypothetical protein